MTMAHGAGLHRFLAALAAFSVLVVLLVVVTARRQAHPVTAVLPGNVAVGEAPEVAAAPQPSPTPVPTVAPRESATYVVPWSAVATPTPAPSRAEAPTHPPRSTRAPQPCVEYTWTAADSPAVVGQMLVEIRIRNRCGRVLQPLEVLFRAEGWRDGQAVYSAQGNLLEKTYPDSVRTVMVALPGSSSYFDRIQVTPINPPAR
jgi:hypothetical protein